MCAQEMTTQAEESSEKIEELIESEERIGSALSEDLTSGLQTGQVTDIELEDGNVSVYYRCGGVFWRSEFDLYSQYDRRTFKDFLNRYGVRKSNLADIVGRKVSVIERRTGPGLVVSGSSHDELEEAVNSNKYKYQSQATNFIYHPRRTMAASFLATVAFSFVLALFSAYFISTFLTTIIMTSMFAVLIGGTISELYPNTPDVKAKPSTAARDRL